MDPKVDDNSLPLNSGIGVASTATKTELNSEPIRLTFDASKAVWGQKYSQFVTLWVAYRYWQNKFGLDHNAELGVCNYRGRWRCQGAPFEMYRNLLYSGITVKF